MPGRDLVETAGLEALTGQKAGTDTSEPETGNGLEPSRARDLQGHPGVERGGGTIEAPPRPIVTGTSTRTARRVPRQRTCRRLERRKLHGPYRMRRQAQSQLSETRCRSSMAHNLSSATRTCQHSRWAAIMPSLARPVPSTSLTQGHRSATGQDISACILRSCYGAKALLSHLTCSGARPSTVHDTATRCQSF